MQVAGGYYICKDSIEVVEVVEMAAVSGDKLVLVMELVVAMVPVIKLGCRPIIKPVEIQLTYTFIVHTHRSLTKKPMLSFEVHANLKRKFLANS